MPELPEVETIRRQLAGALAGATLERIIVYQKKLRGPVPEERILAILPSPIRGFRRHGKYLIFLLRKPYTLLWHFGMSGSFRWVERRTVASKHDHLDLVFSDGRVLRFRDPRRFGFVEFLEGDPYRQPPLNRLGPDPLNGAISGDDLYVRSRNRTVAIKTYLMDQRVVAGIGNIYACEALFVAGVHPAKPAGHISRTRYRRLWDALCTVLEAAIQMGGTSFRDYRQSNGDLGYFLLRCRVYRREGEPCIRCGTRIRRILINQRSTFYCPRCQR